MKKNDIFFWVLILFAINALGIEKRENLGKVYVGGKIGFVDKKGDLVIGPLDFDGAGLFKGGLAFVLKKDNKDFKVGYIDRTGKIIVNPAYETDESIFAGPNEGLGLIILNGKHGFVNSNGDVVIKPHYDDSGLFHEGLAAVKIGNNWGYIDTNGKLVIEAQFEFAHPFLDGQAHVSIHGKWGYINRVGEIIISPIFRDCGDFSEGLAAASIDTYLFFGKKKMFGYIDKKGYFVIKPEFDIADHGCLVKKT